jgi:adenylate cyclase
MQQLTLFSRTEVRTRRSVTTKRSAKSGLKQPDGPKWDLWHQDTEPAKEMALFFLDIRNFTPLAERHDASHVIHIVKKLFSTFQNIIRIHRGQIIETSGDGFYAAFGFNGEIKEAVNAAVQAGQSILKTLAHLNEASFEKTLGQRIDVGIGVHAGKVATGNLAIGNRDHFVVMGYPVNIASRIQAATKEFNNNFIVSSAVFKQLTNPLSHVLKPNAILKGVAEPVDLFLIGRSYSNHSHENLLIF